MRHETVGKVARARGWFWRWIEKMEGRGASGGLAPRDGRAALREDDQNGMSSVPLPGESESGRAAL